MAHKKLQEPEKWITVNGQHLPVYPGGIIGQPGQKDESSTQKDPSVSLERKLAENLKKYNHPNADKEAYNMIQAYKKGQIAPEQLTMWGVSKDELKALSEQGKKEAQADINAGRNTRKVIDPMGNVVKKKAKTEYEKNYGVDMKETKTGKKTATKELGNGLRLTADVSDPYKNYSEVERAKKVNREKQYADKKLNQYRKAAAEEKAKAQSIADAISAKTGIANTSSSSNDTVSEKERKVAEQARKSLMFDKGYAEITANHWNYVKMSNDKVVKALNATDDKYSYELRQEQTKGLFMSPNAVVNHTRIYRTEKKPATTSRNARYDTSRANKAIPKSQVSVSTSQFVGAHGKNPSGRGTWAFFLGKSDEPIFFNGTFAEAKKKAIEEAAKRGISKVTVGS